MSEDPYSILGISKNATKTDIKKAFRDLSKKHHPDKGGEEKTFQKISAAYNILSDDQKRAQFDQFGAAGAGAGFGGASGGFSGGFSQADFGDFEDIFSSFFGGGDGGGRRSSQRSTAQRGADLEVSVVLDFDEAIKGVKKSFTSKNLEPCEKCNGEGGFDKKSCSRCGGTGAVSQKFQTPFGTVAQQTTCPECRGQGISFTTRCSECQGEGRVRQKKDIEINIPLGISDGVTLRLSGKGEAGIRGGARGDLYVHISVRPSNKFRRDGLNLISELEISVFDAILGGTYEVETFWGKVDLKVPENIRDRELLRIKGKGVERDGDKGDHLVRISYKMPKKVSKKLREILEEAKSESR